MRASCRERREISRWLFGSEEEPMFLAPIFSLCVSVVSGLFDRIKPERFIQWTLEVVFDPDFIGEALSDTTGIFGWIVVFLMVGVLIALLKIVVGPFVEVVAFGRSGKPQGRRRKV